MGRIDDHRELRNKLIAQGASLADRLALRIGGEQNRELRQALIRSRRDVFGFRPLDPRDLAVIRNSCSSGGAHPSPPFSELADLHDWDRARAELDAELTAIDADVSLMTAAARDRLATEVADLRFLDGLAIASAAVRNEAASYADNWRMLAEKRLRSTERSLLSYLYRSACKTSPFSTFTTVTMGRLRGGEHPPAQSDVRHTSLALRVLTDIAAGVLQDPQRRTDLRIALTTGLASDEDALRFNENHLRFVRRLQAQPDAPNSDETVFYVKSRRWVEHVVAVLSEASISGRSEHLTVGELIDRLGEFDDDATQQEAGEFIAYLMGLSLIDAPALRIDLRRPDFASGFVSQLRSLGSEWADGLATQVESVDGAAKRVAATSGLDRLRAVRSAENQVSSLLRSVGRAPRSGESVLYEDVVSGSSVKLPEGVIDRLETALATVSDVLPLFDVLLPHRIVLRGYVSRRLQPGDHHPDVLGFIHEFFQDLYGTFTRTMAKHDEFDANGQYVPPQNLMRLPDLDRLAIARQKLIDEMRRRYESHSSSEQPLLLDDDFFATVAAELPLLDRSIDARSHFIQVCYAGESSLGVLNQTYSGLTLMFSRFLNAFDGALPPELPEALREELLSHTPPDSVLAELRGPSESTNLNLHPSLLDFELVCPGDVSSRPKSAQLHVSSLVLRARDDGDVELYSPELGKRVIPVYLGFLLPMALPLIQRVLLLFSPATMVRVNFWQGVEPPLADREIADHPRLQVGSLVLVRRTWRTRPELLPRREQFRRDVSWLLSWSTWRATAKLPRFVFVACDSPDRRANKPQFIDFDSVLSLRILDHVIDRAETRVVFSEMLPGPDDLGDGSEAGHDAATETYVSEHIIEMVGTTEGENR